MTKKKRFWGLPALALVFGLVLAGCDINSEPDWKTVCTYVNESSYTLQMTMESGMGWSPAQFTLKPGDSQLVGTKNPSSPVRATYTHTDVVTYTSGSTGKDTYICTYRDK